MPIYFELLDITANETVSLDGVDAKICTHMNIDIHPRYYGGGLYDWYNTIGFKLAEGYTLEDSNNSVWNYYNESPIWEDERRWLLPIIKFLQTNYKCKSGYVR